jgi:glycosyltransferase involved in cell wall biosynthesis
MISILISVYNKESPIYLDAALHSLVIQTTKIKEIILVKDGILTKELDEVIYKYSSLLPLKVVKIFKNVGLAKALNKGLKYCSYPWVARFDSDDICLPNRFQSQISQIKRNNVDVFGAQIAEFSKNINNKTHLRKLPLNHNHLLVFSKKRNPFNHMTVCFRKNFVLSVGGYPENIPFMEDYALWLKLISKGAKLKNSSKVLVLARAGDQMYRRRGGFKYILSEWKLQCLMLNLGFKGLFDFLFDGITRSSFFILPIFIKKNIYNNFLREKI